MKIRQIRNATTLIMLGDHCLLVDPMLSDKGSFPGFKFFGGGRRNNPLVELPSDAMATMQQATGVLITHEHPDHLDVPGIQWSKSRGLPVWAGELDVPNLRTKGLDARVIRDGDMQLSVEVIPAQHGHGLLGWMMGPVSGFYLAHPAEPSVYITGDTILTAQVRDAIERLKPELVIAPAGAANIGLGRDLLFSVNELVELAKLAPGNVIFNHLEALDHCPTIRQALRERMDSEGVGDRTFIPADGDWLEFRRDATKPRISPQASKPRRPGFQKWLTSKMSGT